MDLSIITGNLAVHDKVAALEKLILSQPQAEWSSNLTCGAGIAAKTVLLKAGTLVVGAMHRYAGMNIMTKGHILIVTDGAPIGYKVVDSPVIVVSPAGTKRVALVLEDTYWTSLMVTDMEDIVGIEKHFLVPPEEQAEFLKLIG